MPQRTSGTTKEPFMAGLFPRKVAKDIEMAEGVENPVKVKKPIVHRGLMYHMKLMQKVK